MLNSERSMYNTLIFLYVICKDDFDSHPFFPNKRFHFIYDLAHLPDAIGINESSCINQFKSAISH